MELSIPTLFFFDPAGDAQRKAQHRDAHAPRALQEKRLFCGACRRPVTHQDERISVHGAHEHTFANPHDFVFHIGCFRDAGGCEAIGAAALEHTWFRGYAWRIAVCSGCRAHLGWRFEAEGDYFHALILNRLTSIGPAKS